MARKIERKFVAVFAHFLHASLLMGRSQGRFFRGGGGGSGEVFRVPELV